MEVVEIMRRLWYEIGELKLNFISSLVEPIVSLLLVIFNSFHYFIFY